MADAVATVAVNLEDGVSSPATNAAGALDKLRRGIDADSKALQAMERSMKNLQKGNVVNIQQFKDLKAKIDAKKQSIASAEASWIALGGTFKNTKRPGDNISSMLETMRQNASNLGGPLAGANSQMSLLSSLMKGGGIALGITAIVAGFVALAAAAVAATIAIAGYAIAAGNARRAELLQLEGLTKIRNWYGIAAGNAKEMQRAIDGVSGSVSIGRDKVAEYSNQLYKAHLRGANLTAALEAVSIAGSAAGEGQAQRIAGWAAAINMTGGSVKKLADDVKARFGGIVTRQMLDLNVQSKKLHESFQALFADLDLEPLLRGVQMVTSLFSQSTASGRALKTILTAVLQPLVNGVAFVAPIVKRFFQGMVIGALALTIAFLKLRNWYVATFTDPKARQGIDWMKVALGAGVAAAGALAASFIVVGAALAAVAAPFLLVGKLIYDVITVAKEMYDYWNSIQWSELGTAMAMGIVNGIKGGAQWVVDAVKEMGGAAWDGFKSKLGIASPSKEFAKLGMNIAEGTEQGVRRGTPALTGAVSDMVALPSAGSARSGSGTSITVNAPITIDGAGKNAEEIGRDLKRQLESIFEGLVIQLGTPA